MKASPTNQSPAMRSTIVTRMASGDERALAALYDAYGHVSYALALAITGAQSTAESVVSEAFAEAWRSATSFDVGRTSVLAWLTAIVRRAALRATSDGRGRGANVERDNSQFWARSAYPVSDAVRALSSAQRQAIELSYYRGLSVREIAKQLGEPESSARELLRSAMHELRQALGPDASAAFDERVVTRA